MICNTIWERYLLKGLCQIFFLFLFSLYFFYIIVDYSIHIQDILYNKTISIKNLVVYYTMLFSKRLDLFLPFSLLIAELKVLISLNRNYELLALQAGGVHINLILRPFFLIALICTLITYLNFEYAIPRSLIFIECFEKQYFNPHTIQKKEEEVHRVPLADGSYLIYQKYNAVSHELFDVYWVLSSDKFFHIKQLSIAETIPNGLFVDLFLRSKNGLIKKIDSYENYSFELLKLNCDLNNYIEKPMETRSITELIQLYRNMNVCWKVKKNTIQTHLYSKMLRPFLPFFVIIGVSPFVIRFSRSLSVFLLFSITIFGYIFFFIILEASTLLGESHILSPFSAIFIFPLFFLAYFAPKFFKLG